MKTIAKWLVYTHISIGSSLQSAFDKCAAKVLWISGSKHLLNPRGYRNRTKCDRKYLIFLHSRPEGADHSKSFMHGIIYFNLFSMSDYKVVRNCIYACAMLSRRHLQRLSNFWALIRFQLLGRHRALQYSRKHSKSKIKRTSRNRCSTSTTYLLGTHLLSWRSLSCRCGWCIDNNARRIFLPVRRGFAHPCVWWLDVIGEWNLSFLKIVYTYQAVLLILDIPDVQF